METARSTQSISGRSLKILVSLWSFVFGVLVSSFITISPVFSVFLITLSGVIFIIERKRISREVILLILVVSMFALGSLRYSVKNFHEEVMPLSTGVVVSEPEHRDIDTRFVFESDNGVKTLVSTDMYSSLRYGDRVEVEGKMKTPSIIEDESGRKFDYAAYLAKDDIYYTMSFARVNILEHDNGNVLLSNLYRVKNSVVGKMKTILPEPESSLLAGLIVAGKDALPERVLEDFKNAGIVHIVVLSGFNITIIAEFFLALFATLPLRRRAWAAAVAILLFVLMAGASASIVRAMIMAVAVLVGRVIHRPYSAPRALLLAAALMLLENPKLLVFDPSFQLSFLAMLALIYVEPIVSKRLSFISTRWGIRTLVSATVATQVVVLPYFLYSSGSVSIVSLLSNVLVLPLVPTTMLVGFVSTLISYVSLVLTTPFAYVSHLLLMWILGVAQVLGSLSYSHIKVSHFPLWLTLLCYSLIVLTVWRSRSSPRPSSN